jgi:monoterpene epsilon-lactone hydrolase
VLKHPLDPHDAAVTSAIHAQTTSTKGAERGVDARPQFDALMESVEPRDEVRYEEDTVGGIPGLWVHPPKPWPGPAILHLHAGWFSFGTARAFRHFVGQIVARVKTSAFIPDYRLAPENPFPAATDDVWRAIRGSPSRVTARLRSRATRRAVTWPWVWPPAL